MSEQDTAQSAPGTNTIAATCESPPAAPAPVRESIPDPRVRLLALAQELVRSNNRRLVIEYLRLRRTLG